MLPRREVHLGGVVMNKKDPQRKVQVPKQKRALPPPGRKLSLAEARANTNRKFAEALKMLAEH